MMKTRVRQVWPLAVWVLAGCADNGDHTAADLTPIEYWTTEAEYEIGDQMEGEALFGSYLDVHPVADGSRVYVLDSEGSEVTIWTPDGTLIRRLGGAGEGPGEFLRPSTLVFFDDGFYVKDDRRITTFTPDGDLVTADAFPRGVDFQGLRVQYRDMFNDGSFAALPSPEILDGSATRKPTEDLPVLRVSQEGGAWRAEALASLSLRDLLLRIDEGSPFSAGPMQPWVEPDRFQLDAVNGSVVVGRAHRLPPGVLEFTEISVQGDTVWTRRIQLPPVPLEEDEVEVGLEELARWAAAGLGDSVASPSLRRRLREALIIPKHWPAFDDLWLMSNGEVWVESAEGDTTSVWYAIPKGADGGPIRRIVLPESFSPRDVNDTHVWGVRYDELDVTYVVGLRLVRSS